MHEEIFYREEKKNIKMNTVLARLNAAFAYTLTVMGELTFFCFASTFWNDNLTQIEIKTGNVHV